MGGHRLRSRGDDRRAQSSVLGLTLVFGIVLAGAFAVLALGATAIGDTQERLSVQRAEKALTEFDSDAALVALGNTDVQEVSFGELRESDFETQEGVGWMKIVIENQTSGTTQTLLNESMGAITYEGKDTTLAYQGGGVWKRSGNGSRMVSPPEFHFRNGTLTLPVVNVTGAPSLGDIASIRHVETIKKYPDPAAGDENPLSSHLVKVKVKSDYYQGWGSYFEERTDGEVEYNHTRNTATLTLVSPINVRRMTAATASLSASGTFQILGSTHGDCNSDDYTDSYNSSGTSDDYCDQWLTGLTDDNGDVVYGKDINISQGSGGDEIRGDVVSGGDVTVGTGAGKPYVYGNINYTDNCNPSPTDCALRITEATASVNSITGIRTAAPVTYYIRSTVKEAKSSNDNSSPQIVSNQLDYSGVTTRELDEGKYYLERIDMNDDEVLKLNTTGGDITIAVEEYIRLQGSSSGAEIKVIGNGTVRMFVNGTSTVAGHHLHMEKKTGILNDGDDAKQFRLYGKPDFIAYIGGGGSNGAKYVGVIYAPPGDFGTGNVTLDTGEVYGGVLTGTTTILDGSIHYDEALENTPIISRDAKVLRITYLHVSINRIRVE